MQKLIMNAEHYPLNNCQTNGLESLSFTDDERTCFGIYYNLHRKHGGDFFKAIYTISLNEQKRKRRNFLGNYKIFFHSDI